MAQEITLKWKALPADGDYKAALSYLSLVMEPTRGSRLVQALRSAPIVSFCAKDLLRSSGLALLPEDDPRVRYDLRKIAKGKPLSPVLLVRGDVFQRIPLIVADGYHRICSSYHFDENVSVHCRIVSIGRASASSARS